MPAKKHYICAGCKKKYVQVTSQAEMEQEYTNTFGSLSKNDRAVVCDDCYAIVMEKIAASN